MGLDAERSARIAATQETRPAVVTQKARELAAGALDLERTGMQASTESNKHLNPFPNASGASRAQMTGGC